MRITPTDLLLLALLAEEPSYGWQLDEKLKARRADLWAEYSRPHLYYSLRKLNRHGYLEPQAGDQRESRRIYALAAKGRQALAEPHAARELIKEHTAFTFDLLLSFPSEFGTGPDDFETILAARRDLLEQELGATQELWREAEIAGNLQFGRLAVIRHRIKFLKSELDFLKWLAKNTSEGWASLAQDAADHV
jgi:DNA-binding PadR family transcriptional regulator